MLGIIWIPLCSWLFHAAYVCTSLEHTSDACSHTFSDVPFAILAVTILSCNFVAAYSWDFCLLALVVHVQHNYAIYHCRFGVVSGVFNRSLGNGVRKNGVRNRCPYRRCGVDTEIPYRLPFWREFCLFSPVRVAPGVDTEFPYRVRIVDRGVDCRDPVCRPVPDSFPKRWRASLSLAWFDGMTLSLGPWMHSSILSNN